MKLVALPEAIAEFEEAVAYYEEQRPGLGLDFFLAIEATVDFEDGTNGTDGTAQRAPKSARSRDAEVADRQRSAGGRHRDHGQSAVVSRPPPWHAP